MARAATALAQYGRFFAVIKRLFTKSTWGHHACRFGSRRTAWPEGVDHGGANLDNAGLRIVEFDALQCHFAMRVVAGEMRIYQSVVTFAALVVGQEIGNVIDVVYG